MENKLTLPTACSFQSVTAILSILTATSVYIALNTYRGGKKDKEKEKIDNKKIILNPSLVRIPALPYYDDLETSSSSMDTISYLSINSFKNPEHNLDDDLSSIYMPDTEESQKKKSLLEEYLSKQRVEGKGCSKYWKDSNQFCEQKRQEDKEKNYSFINMNTNHPRFRFNFPIKEETSETYKVAVSNRKLIETALLRNFLAGSLMEKKKKHIMSLMKTASSTISNFILLLNDNNTPMTLLGIYSYENTCDQLIKLFGKGPKIIQPHLIYQFYRYNCGSHLFITINEPTTVKKVDAISLYRG